MNDNLGDRMKNNYEDRTRFSLPRRTYVIIRLDGKAFHTYTKGLKKPFDMDLIDDMTSAVKAILPQIQGAEFAYVQSDEVSILLTDFEKETTNAWFDNNIQKICSVSASLMTASFNAFRYKRYAINTLDRSFSHISGGNGEVYQRYSKAVDESLQTHSLACFDARTFSIPDWIEVHNYFVWRNNDASRNSVSMMAQSLYSHKELQGKSSKEMIEMIRAKGYDWEHFDPTCKHGRIILRDTNISDSPPKPCWVAEPAWIFSQKPESLQRLIPKYT